MKSEFSMRTVIVTALAGACLAVFFVVKSNAATDTGLSAVSVPVEAEALVEPEVDAVIEPTLDLAVAQPSLPSALAGVAALVDAGRGAQALAKLSSTDVSPPAQFLRAQALANVGRHADAVKVLSDVAPLLDVLQGRAHCHRATSLVALKRWTEAANAWEACSEDSSRHLFAQLQRARALGEAGDSARALAAATVLASVASPVRAEALAVMGRLQEATGLRHAALETWRSLYVEEPLSPHAGEADKRMQSLMRTLKAEPIEMSRLVDRVDRLMRAKHTRAAALALRHIRTKPVCQTQPCLQRCQNTDVEAVKTGVEAREAAPFVLNAIDAEEQPQLDRTLPACAVVTIETPADPVDCKAQLLEGWVAQRVRAFSKALPLLRDVYAKCEEPESRGLALFLAADSAARLKDSDADDLARILSRQFPADSFGDDALLAASKRAKEREDYALERAFLNEIVWFHWEGDQRPEALFRLFWSHRREGHPERGLNALAALSGGYDAQSGADGGDAERGRYWWGRTVAELADEDEQQQGIDALATLSRDRPMTYYGLLSRSWLAEKGRAAGAEPVLTPLNDEPLRLGPLADTGLLETASALLSYGLPSQARELLLAIDRAPLRAAGAAGQEASLLIAELVSMTGDARMAHHIARRDLLGLMRDVSEPLARRAAQVAYPFVFRDSIEKWSGSNGVDPNLLQGLMREESAFDPRARSPVGARGLTQVMPATGKEVAKNLSLKNFNVDDLWNPDTNVRLGSWYLGRMLKRFEHPGLAAAAYNAGPGNMSKWLARGMPESIDAFVEEIPFDETHGYVKRVLRSYAAYGYLSQQHADDVLTVSTEVLSAVR